MKPCKVCMSPNKLEYNSMRLEGKSLKFILLYAHSQHKENNLTYHNFQKHFLRHLRQQLTKQHLEQKLKQTLTLAQTVMDNLIDLSELLATQLNTVESMKETLRKYLDLI